MHDIRELLRKIQAQQSAQRRQGFFVRAVSVLVVVSTVWAMILPGVAMETGAGCPLEEHTHTENCYSCTHTGEQRVLICSREALGIHQHTAECANIPEGCKIADYVVHTHDASCMDEEDMVCTLPEIKAHTHTEECYILMTHSHVPECFTQERGELACGLEGMEEHTHTDECYEMIQVNLCGMEEGQQIPESRTCV
jgi:hypothetical protein